MEETFLQTYGSIQMMIYAIVFCGIIGASSTQINGTDIPDSTKELIVFFKQLLDGFVMAAVVSVPAAIVLTGMNINDGLFWSGLVGISVIAPGILRYAKINGLDLLIAKLPFGAKTK